MRGLDVIAGPGGSGGDDNRVRADRKARDSQVPVTPADNERRIAGARVVQETGA